MLPASVHLSVLVHLLPRVKGGGSGRRRAREGRGVAAGAGNGGCGARFYDWIAIGRLPIPPFGVIAVAAYHSRNVHDDLLGIESHGRHRTRPLACCCAPRRTYSCTLSLLPPTFPGPHKSFALLAELLLGHGAAVYRQHHRPASGWSPSATERWR